MTKRQIDKKLSRLLSAYGLTMREQDVALAVFYGRSNQAIAEELGIVEQTVKDHLHRVFGKMQIRRRSELAPKLLQLSSHDVQAKLLGGVGES